MKTFTIALLQISAHNHPEINRIKGEIFCRQAHARGAHLALFPEMWNNGYRLYHPAGGETLEAWAAQAVGREDPFVQGFRRLAQELGMAIGLTVLERWTGLPRNTLYLIDRQGEIALTYAKVHTCEWDQEKYLTPGERFPVCDLDYGTGTVRLGAMICFDREFPEPARILMLEGAEIILTPNACPNDAIRRCQLVARAYENMTGIALANYPGEKMRGGSLALDGMAFGEDEQPRSMVLVEAGQDEGLFLASFDLEALRAYRQREVWGNAYRRPRLYGALARQEVVPPFERADARR